MRAVVQRVSEASVTIGEEVIGRIGVGLMVLLGVSRSDGWKEAEVLAAKIPHLRVFEDADGKMNRSLLDVGGELLVVSQFTLLGDCRKGRRPGFDDAAEPAIAEQLYEKTASLIADKGLKVAKGIFGAYMQVASVNDGPVTFILDSACSF